MTTLPRRKMKAMVARTFTFLYFFSSNSVTVVQLLR